jgi:hypothetical protein
MAPFARADRARSGLDPERGNPSKELYDAAACAAIAPDEGRRLDELCGCWGLHEDAGSSM